MTAQIIPFPKPTPTAPSGRDSVTAAYLKLLGEANRTEMPLPEWREHVAAVLDQAYDLCD
jgi:hypothetical protein